MTNAKGLNATQLKIIALLCMTVDHIGEFGEAAWGIPFWFRIIGRIAAPIFVFLVAQGVRKTRSPLRYMLRLYAMSAVMTLINAYVTGGAVRNNIMGTMFYIVLLSWLFGRFCELGGGKKVLCGLAAAAAVAVPCAVSYLLSGSRLAGVAQAFLPSILLVEGGVLIVALGFSFYLCGDSREKYLSVYAVFCAAYLALTLSGGSSLAELFISDIQWLQVLALPFLMLYNKQRGRGLKWLFYIYYPAHIYLIFWLSTVLPRG